MSSTTDTEQAGAHIVFTVAIPHGCGASVQRVSGVLISGTPETVRVYVPPTSTAAQAGTLLAGFHIVARDRVDAITPAGTALPRYVVTNDVWPPEFITEIRNPSVCRHCGQPVAYFQGEWTGSYVHTATERSRCELAGQCKSAAPVPTCPQCGGHDIRTDRTDPWADYTRCPCGWELRYSLGD